jgi:hypothetical protein
VLCNLIEGQVVNYDVVSARQIGSRESASNLALGCDLTEIRRSDSDGGRMIMARKPATRAEFVLFDVFYENGSRRSNRRVPSEILGGLDGDAPARSVIEEQDRLIAERSGNPVLVVKSIRRSGAR